MAKEYPERKLDFHAPLLSTRRPGRIIVPREKWDLDSSCGFNDRVPFSWEQSPGKPKEMLLRHRRNEENRSNLAFILPLKPPPIRLHPHSQHSKEDSSLNQEDDDEGCDGDVDENDDEDIDFYSGGLDLFSLAESSDNGMAPRKDRKVVRKSGGGGGGGGGRRRAPPTPSFMMERFLPAAVALAAESLEMAGSGGDGLASPAGDCTPKVVGGGKRVLLPSVSVTSPLAFKSCGLENLLPWRARPKKSAVKGPLRFGCSDWKPQLSPRHK